MVKEKCQVKQRGKPRTCPLTKVTLSPLTNFLNNKSLPLLLLCLRSHRVETCSLRLSQHCSLINFRGTCSLSNHKNFTPYYFSKPNERDWIYKIILYYKAKCLCVCTFAPSWT